MDKLFMNKIYNMHLENIWTNFYFMLTFRAEMEGTISLNKYLKKLNKKIYLLKCFKLYSSFIKLLHFGYDFYKNSLWRSLKNNIILY